MTPLSGGIYGTDQAIQIETARRPKTALASVQAASDPASPSASAIFASYPTASGHADAVITSPPYPNEKDYTRTTRLESVLLGFIRTKQDSS